MATNNIVLTAESRKKLEEELEYREGELSREIVERIKVARDFGDLSENSEYDAAKDEQAKNAARIRQIRAQLANAVEVDGGDVRSLIVSVGCKVSLVDGDGVATEVELVSTTDTNSLEHKISNESPIGAAILGRGEGETVEVTMPSGKTRIYTITKISR